MTASLLLQEALCAALRAAGYDVFDGPPAEAALPYVTIGSEVVTDISTKTEVRREHRYAVAVWAAAEAVAAVKPAMAAIEAAVLAVPAELGGGWRLVANGFLRSATRAETARGLVAGTVEFRARTERTAAGG